MVEAERIELSSQAAIDWASTSIADHLVLTLGSPIGRLSVARSFRLIVRMSQKAVLMRKPACFAPSISAAGEPNEGGPLESDLFYLTVKLGSQRVRALGRELGVRVCCFAAFYEASGASACSPGDQSLGRNLSPPLFFIITQTDAILFPIFRRAAYRGQRRSR